MEIITSTMPRMRNIKYESACLKTFDNYPALPRISARAHVCVCVCVCDRVSECTHIQNVDAIVWLDLYTLVNNLTGWSLMTWGSFPSRAGFSFV